MSIKIIINFIVEIRSVTFLAPTAFPSTTDIVYDTAVYTPTTTTPSEVPTYIPTLPSGQPTAHPTYTPTLRSGHPTSKPQQVPTDGGNKTYVGLLSYKDPLKCKELHSFVIYPTSSCLVMANAHPDQTGYISGHNKYSCGSNGVSIMSYSPTDTTCSEEPYDIYALPNYNKCPAAAELQMHTCLNAASFPTLSKSVRGVVNT